MGIKDIYRHPSLIPDSHSLWINNWKIAVGQKLINLSDYKINSNDIEPEPGRAWYEQGGLKGISAYNGTEWRVMQGFNKISDNDGVIYMRAQHDGIKITVGSDGGVKPEAGTESGWFTVIKVNKDTVFTTRVGTKIYVKKGEAIFIPIYDRIPY